MSSKNEVRKVIRTLLQNEIDNKVFLVSLLSAWEF